MPSGRAADIDEREVMKLDNTPGESLSTDWRMLRCL